MTITSFWFFVFLIIGVVIYYIVPKRGQWVILLLMSLVYFHFAAEADYAILFPLISTATAFFTGWLVRSGKLNGKEKVAFAIAFMAVVINIIIWFLLKGSSFWMLLTNLLHRVFPAIPALPAIPLAQALGMGYYTAQVIAYIMDCYWGNIEPQRNFLKLFLFVTFFPQTMVGPISRYSQMECLYERHALKYVNICHGTQRLLWGLLKKLVISDRVGILVGNIWQDTLLNHGFWPWVAVLLYPLQIYTDFSGCMDIVLGVAELFDIHMAENFHNPFFSRNSQEFWQRWHITLGAWARDYVYYPVLKSSFIQSIGGWARKHFKKRTAKFIPWAVGMGVLWFVMGFWHGSTRHILGVSVYFWSILVLSEWFSPCFKKAVQKLKINTECFSWHLFQSIRTYIVYSIGAVAFSANRLTEAVAHYGVLIRSFKMFNPWIFVDGSVQALGLTHDDINVLVVAVLLLIIVDVLNERLGSVRDWIDKQNTFFRWGVYLFLFFAVAIFGVYGPGYDASTFIYGIF